jgi:hypothetical protein
MFVLLLVLSVVAVAVLILLAACMFYAFMLLLFFYYAMRNKTPVADLMPAPTSPGPDVVPYVKEVNEAAREQGFEYAGTFIKDYGAVTVCLWRSPAHDVWVMVQDVWSKIHERESKNGWTILVSRMSEDRYLVTADDDCRWAFMCDLGRLLDFEFLYRAEFLKIVDRHTDRLAASALRPIRCGADIAAEFAEVMAAEVRNMEQKGYAYFLDPAQTTWRYTLKGALVWLFRLDRWMRRGPKPPAKPVGAELK